MHHLWIIKISTPILLLLCPNMVKPQFLARTSIGIQNKMSCLEHINWKSCNLPMWKLITLMVYMRLIPNGTSITKINSASPCYKKQTQEHTLASKLTTDIAKQCLKKTQNRHFSIKGKRVWRFILKYQGPSKSPPTLRMNWRLFEEKTETQKPAWLWLGKRHPLGQVKTLKWDPAFWDLSEKQQKSIYTQCTQWLYILYRVAEKVVI